MKVKKQPPINRQSLVYFDQSLTTNFCPLFSALCPLPFALCPLTSDF